jgi:predicted O-methyltransferase YrrM
MRRSRDRQWGLVVRTLKGVLRNAVRNREELRFHAMRDAWVLTKRFGSLSIRNIRLADLPAVQDAPIEGYFDDPNRAVLAAICQTLEAQTFFEIGTNRGRTAWTVARNNPGVHVYTLDLADPGSMSEAQLALTDSDRDFFVQTNDRGEAYLGTGEESRITTLVGDSATFDFSPYAGNMDVIFIDGSHSYEYVRNDTERALAMVTDGGVIAWDDYPAIPGVYRYLNEIAPELEHPLYHIVGTRLVIYTASDLVARLASAERGRPRQFAA